MSLQTTNGKTKATSKNMAKNAKPTKVIKSTKSTVDYRVCKEAMEDPKRFEELARWGREEIKIAEKDTSLELLRIFALMYSSN